MRSIFLLGVFLAVGSAHASSLPVGEDDVRTTIKRALPWLAEEGQWWIDEKKCTSCHHTAFLVWSHNLAAERGFDVDLNRLDEWTRWSRQQLLEIREDSEVERVGERNIEGLSELILGGDPGSWVEFGPLIMKTQQAGGDWRAGGQLPTQKRPLPETTQISTMWAALALDRLGAGAEQHGKAIKWLRSAAVEAQSTEWFALHVALEKRFGDEAAIEGAAQQLLARQNADGGWSWVDGDPSDAMATGQALYGLSEAGAGAGREAVSRAWKFLVETQRENGSWEVKSSKQKNREKSGRISDFFGSSWATVGLLRSLSAD